VSQLLRDTVAPVSKPTPEIVMVLIPQSVTVFDTAPGVT
jgi:hypothetical protein